jgi:hypothetical protein
MAYAKFLGMAQGGVRYIAEGHGHDALPRLDQVGAKAEHLGEGYPLPETLLSEGLVLADTCWRSPAISMRPLGNCAPQQAWGL